MNLRTLGVFSCIFALCIIAVLVAQAQTESVLYRFAGTPDGANPLAVLAEAKSNLYGTTNVGGANGWGTVFKLTRTGTETILHSFAYDGTDGVYPYFSGVVFDKSGNLFGATALGGTDNSGTVYEITPSGTETILHSFVSNGIDGLYPYGGVVLDRSGNIYGTTFQGGSYNCGTVYRVTPTGSEAVLYSFAGGTDGRWPFADDLFLWENKVLYGTTLDGGVSGYGTVFSLTLSGKETVLHSFANGSSDGAYPYAGVVLDKDGNIYGATSGGGPSNKGTVYKITPTGSESVVYFFGAYESDGSGPSGELIFDKSGNLYGTTIYGGAYGDGTVFEITSSGTETVLHSFDNNGADGANPWAGLVLGQKNTLYGTTYSGGTDNHGTVFKVVP